MIEDEIWKPMVGFPEHEVSNYGVIRCLFGRSKWGRKRLDTPRVLKTSLGNSGHPRVGMRRDGKNITVFCHKAVLLAFVGPQPAGKESGHMDGTRTNNYVGNLKWITHQENVDHRKIHGTHLSGERLHSAKLTFAQVQEIRSELKRGATKEGLGRRYKVKGSTIYQIATGRTWRDSYQPPSTEGEK